MNASHSPVRSLATSAALLALLLAGCAEPVPPVAAAQPGTVAAAQPGTVAPVPAPWAWAMPDCVGYRAADYAAPRHRLRSEPDGAGVRETYQAGWGALAVAEIRRVVAECASFEHGGRADPSAYREQNVVVECGFAGDESLLVRTTRLHPPGARAWYAAVVRRSDVVVTVRAESPAGARCAAAPGRCQGAGG